MSGCALLPAAEFTYPPGYLVIVIQISSWPVLRFVVAS